MDPESLHIKSWKELLDGFERAKSYVIFSHGTVVIFDKTHKENRGTHLSLSLTLFS